MGEYGHVAAVEHASSTAATRLPAPKTNCPIHAWLRFVRAVKDATFAALRSHGRSLHLMAPGCTADDGAN